MFTKPDNRYLMNQNIDVYSGIADTKRNRAILVSAKFALDIQSINKSFHTGIFTEDEWFVKMDELKTEFLEAYDLLSPKKEEDENVHSEN